MDAGRRLLPAHPGEQWLINQKINTNVLAWWDKAPAPGELVFMGDELRLRAGCDLVEERYGEPIESLYTYAMTKRCCMGRARPERPVRAEVLCAVPSLADWATTDDAVISSSTSSQIIRGKSWESRYSGGWPPKREVVLTADFIAALLALVERVDDDLVNIGAGEEHSIREFAARICRIVGYPAEQIRYDTSRYVGATSKCLSIAKLRRLVPGYRVTPLDQGLEQTIAWFHERRPTSSRMRLLIVDPRHFAGGHSYNYDAAICEAAKALRPGRGLRRPQFVDQSAHPGWTGLKSHSVGHTETRRECGVHPFCRRSAGTAARAPHHRAECLAWLIGSQSCAPSICATASEILRGIAAAASHGAYWSWCRRKRLVRRRAPPAYLHLVLRYSPELVNSGQLSPARFGKLLAGLAEAVEPRVHLYTDSERLSAQYAALAGSPVITLPVPLLAAPPPAVSEGDRARVHVAFLGAARVEKGFCELPRLIERFPPGLGATVQIARDSPDPRIREAVRELEALAARLPAEASSF
jgi:GDP-L-fucose synthase